MTFAIAISGFYFGASVAATVVCWRCMRRAEKAAARAAKLLIELRAPFIARAPHHVRVLDPVHDWSKDA